MKHERPSSKKPAGSPIHSGHGHGDSLVAWLRKERFPVTRQNYLELAYGSKLPEPWTPEHEAELPEELQPPLARYACAGR
jgi:hypothetical protein